MNLDVLDECVRQADAQGFSTRQAMWKEAVKLYGSRISPVSVSTVRRRTRIVPTTPLGARGGYIPGSGCIPCRRRTYPGAVVQALRTSVPAEFQHLVDLQIAGSRAAAQKLKCLECSGWSKSEACRCEDMGCPLWFFRTFGKKRQKNLAVV